MIKVNQWWGEWLTSTKKSQKQNRKTCRSFGQNHPIRKNKWPSCPACVWYIIIIIIYLHIVWPKRSKFYRIRKKWRWPIGSCIFLVDLNFPKKNHCLTWRHTFFSDYFYQRYDWNTTTIRHTNHVNKNLVILPWSTPFIYSYLG